MEKNSFKAIVLKNKTGENSKTVITFSDDSYRVVPAFIGGEAESFHQEICAQLKRCGEGGKKTRFHGIRLCSAADFEKTSVCENGSQRMAAGEAENRRVTQRRRGTV